MITYHHYKANTSIDFLTFLLSSPRSGSKPTWCSINGNKLIKRVHKNVKERKLLYHRAKMRLTFVARVHILFCHITIETSEAVHTIRDNRCRAASNVVMCTLVFATLFFNDFHLYAIRWNINSKQKKFRTGV